MCSRLSWPTRQSSNKGTEFPQSSPSYSGLLFRLAVHTLLVLATLHTACIGQRLSHRHSSQNLASSELTPLRVELSKFEECLFGLNAPLCSCTLRVLSEIFASCILKPKLQRYMAMLPDFLRTLTGKVARVYLRHVVHDKVHNQVIFFHMLPHVTEEFDQNMTSCTVHHDPYMTWTLFPVSYLTRYLTRCLSAHKLHIDCTVRLWAHKLWVVISLCWVSQAMIVLNTQQYRFTHRLHPRGLE
jgi:hypothetical protein